MRQSRSIQVTQDFHVHLNLISTEPLNWAHKHTACSSSLEVKDQVRGPRGCGGPHPSLRTPLYYVCDIWLANTQGLIKNLQSIQMLKASKAYFPRCRRKISRSQMLPVFFLVCQWFVLCAHLNDPSSKISQARTGFFLKTLSYFSVSWRSRKKSQ